MPYSTKFWPDDFVIRVTGPEGIRVTVPEGIAGIVEEGIQILLKGLERHVALQVCWLYYPKMYQDHLKRFRGTYSSPGRLA